MPKLKPYSAKLKDKVLLVGYSPDGKCVYSSFITVHAYYDDLHPWDDAKQIKSISLHLVRGYIFGSSGNLEQEFESHFDIETGIFSKGWSKDEDGNISE